MPDLPWIRIAACALVLGLQGCSDPMAPQLEALDRARDRWEGEGPASYRYDYRNACFCPVLNARVTVVDGEVADIEILSETPGEIPGEPVGFTIEELLARIRSALEAEPHRADLEYDPALGYPREAWFDPIENAVDDEWGFVVTNFQPL